MGAAYSIERNDNVYTASTNINESTSVSAISILSSNDDAQLVYLKAWLSCSVACAFTIERGGTAPTSTTLAVNSVNPNNVNVQPSTTLAFSASNAGGSPKTIWSVNLAAGIPLVVDLKDLGLIVGSGVVDTVTFRSSSVSGNVGITVFWQEL